MPHYPYNYRPMAPNPVTLIACTVCNNLYPSETPDAGCYSAQSVPIATLVTATKCETCYRRVVSASTVGAVNVKDL